MERDGWRTLRNTVKSRQDDGGGGGGGTKGWRAVGGLFIAGMAGAVVGLHSGQTIINASLVSFNSISCHNVTS